MAISAVTGGGEEEDRREEEDEEEEKELVVSPFFSSIDQSALINNQYDQSQPILISIGWAAFNRID